MTFYGILIRNVVSLVLLILWTQGSAFSQATALDSLKAPFQEGKVFQASINHFYVDALSADTSEIKGSIWIHSKGYKVLSTDRMLAVNGSTSMVYTPVKNQVIYSDYLPEDDDFAPSRFLLASEEEFELMIEKGENSQKIINLNSKDPFSIFQKVTMTVDSLWTPLKISATDQSGNENYTLFSKGSYQEFTSSVESLDFPDTVEIIDLRIENRE